MKVLVITSCTGEKNVDHKRALTLKDFQKGKEHIKKREKQLEKVLTPARDLYSGQQHLRLMRGIHTAADKVTKNPIKVDLKIISAGYGLIPGSRKIAPYEATFNDMGKAELVEWANQLNIPKSFRNTVSKPYDLILVLLGDKYLATCDIDESVKFGGPTLILCSGTQAKKIPTIKKVKTLALINKEAKRFSCGLIGLKGELTARILEHLSNAKTFKSKLFASTSDVLSLLDTEKKVTKELKLPAKKTKAKEKPKRPPARANPSVDHVIDLPKSWKEKPHKQKLRYFIPEWDDLVDPDYDFITDTHSGGTGDWSNQVYAHQMYPEPNYDGILVSRAVAEGSKKKNARINEMGVHRFLRVPRELSIMGDCGAFDYINEKEPPYTTDDVIDYYTRLDFDLGVSVDHLIVPAFDEDKQFRYDLTVNNAHDFIKEHKKLGLKWQPIGAVQGWDVNSYVKAAKKYIRFGYKYIALGGLVRSQTPIILKTVEAVRAAIPKDVQIHIFGFSRFDAINDLVRAGANSIDSASMLRKAWLGSNLNYLTPTGWYPAIRIPQAQGSFRAKRLVSEGKASLKQLQKLEHNCLSELREYASSKGNPPHSLIKHLVEYDTLVAGKRPGTAERIQMVLEDRPWEKCGCAICQKWGVEVVIFRGNNRNRRRGFHNTHVFYELMQDILNGKRTSLKEEPQIELLNDNVLTG